MAAAGEAVGAPQAAVESETVIASFDAASGALHLLVSARLRARGKAAYLFSAPGDATLGGPIEGAPTAVATLSGLAAPPFAEAVGARVLAGDGAVSRLKEACGALGITCSRGALEWAGRVAESGRSLVIVPAAGEDLATTGYVHLVAHTSFGVLPYAQPQGPSVEGSEPPLPTEERPARVGLWAELGLETKGATWERSIDRALAGCEPALHACFGAELAKNRRASGDLHVQLRLLPTGKVTVDGHRASTEPMARVVRCLAPELEKLNWPPPPTSRPTSFEVHATLKPPAPLPRAYRAFVFATDDVEPHVGLPDDPRRPLSMQVTRSFEPSSAELRQALGSAAGALGLDLSTRHRFVVLDASPDEAVRDDDIALRRLAPARVEAGQAPLPIIERGDRPTAPPSKKKTPFRRRALGAGLVLSLAVVAAAIYLAEIRAEKARRRPHPLA